MKKFISLFLVFSLLALSGNLIAKERRGAEIIITKKDGQQVRGELFGVKHNSLLLLVQGVDTAINVNEIEVIRIVKKSKFWTGAGTGLLALGGLGTLLGLAMDNVELGLLTGLFGLVGGGISGAMAGTDVKIQIGGRPEEEVNIILEYLRSKARYPNYQ